MASNSWLLQAHSSCTEDNDGKEYTLFLPPHPVKGKPLDKIKMFGGQITQLLKQVESGNKCGKHMGNTKRKSEDSSSGQNKRQRFNGRQGRAPFRGFRSRFSSFRGRGRQQQSFGWNDNNRPGPGFRQSPSGAQGKPPGTPRGPQK